MRTRFLHFVVVALASSVSNLTCALADSPAPGETPSKPVLLERPAAVGALGDDRSITVAGELAAIKGLARQLDRRIRRLETMLDYDRAVRIRRTALEAWQELQTRRDTLIDFRERDSQLRAKYFEAREDANRVLQRLGKMDE